MEWIQKIISELNNYAGLFSLLAVVVAIVVPWIIYRKTQKAHKQELQNELEAMEEDMRWAFSSEERQMNIRKRKLEKDLGRK